jgi:hypothetical protein
MKKALDMGIMVFTFMSVLILNMVFRINFFLCILMIVPLLLVFSITYNILYNSRSGLKPEPIPAGIFGEQLNALNQISLDLKPQGFDRIDDFHLQMIPDTIVYVFKHREMPCYLCLYNIGGTIAKDVLTFFKNDYALTTTISVSGGNLPRGNRAFLQIYPNAPQEPLFEGHLKGLEFLKSKGLEPIEVNADQLRTRFMESFAKTWALVKKKPVWPLFVLYTAFTNPGKVYAKPIEQQFNEGIAKIED